MKRQNTFIFTKHDKLREAISNDESLKKSLTTNDISNEKLKKKNVVLIKNWKVYETTPILNFFKK